MTHYSWEALPHSSSQWNGTHTSKYCHMRPHRLAQIGWYQQRPALVGAFVQSSWLKICSSSAVLLLHLAKICLTLAHQYDVPPIRS